MAGSLTIDNINGKVISSSPVATESQVIGVGQTWQNVTASRSTNTTYTNTTGKPIVVCPTMANNGPTAFYINGIIVGYITSYGSPNGSSCYIVPNGSTYLIGNSVAMLLCFELR